MITKEKMRNTFMLLYMVIIGFLSYTAFYSPFMMKEYANNIIYSSFLILFVTYYLYDFKYLKTWFKDRVFHAKIEYEKRKKAKAIVDKEYEQYAKY